MKLRKLNTWLEKTRQSIKQRLQGQAPPKQQGIVVEVLEPRVLFSADSNPFMQGAPDVADSDIAEVRSLSGSDSLSGSAVRQYARSHELILVDESVLSKQAGLIDALMHQNVTDEQGRTRVFDVRLITSDKDGLDQISAIASLGQQWSAVHLVSHGANGSIRLGNSDINSTTLAVRNTQFQALQTLFTGNRDFLLYGCDLASDEQGQSFLRSLGSLTDTDIAANTGQTGNPQRKEDHQDTEHDLLTTLADGDDTDWTLDYHLGQIQTALALSSAIQSNWHGVLATFTVTNTNDSGAGSLRAAITNANSMAGADTIDFNIAGIGVHTITLATDLPAIQDTVRLDGNTQNGSLPLAPLIEISGNNLAGNVLTFASGSGSSVIRGLSLFGAQYYGLQIDAGSDANIVEGLLVGLRADGSTIVANGMGGIVVSSNGNTIGGSSAASRNVSSGNVNGGLWLNGANNLVVGNYFGTDVTGTLSRPNSDGIDIYGHNNQIGGGAVTDRNIISGNSRSGIELIGGSAVGNAIQGNWIGLDANGTAMGNSVGGMWIGFGASGNLIGGVTANLGNVIAANQGNTIEAGVGIETASFDNAIIGNLIYNNESLGIDDNMDGVTANDAGDADDGGNRRQNAPVLISAISSGGNSTIAGTLNSSSSKTFRIEFFSSPVGDPSGYGEGQVFLGWKNVTTDSAGHADINAFLPGISITAGHKVTSTATVDFGTGSFGDTSEFSANVTATGSSAGVSVTPPGGTSTSEGGSSLTYQVVLTAAPTANVSIPVSSSDTTEGTVNVTQLVFTPANWNIAQAVTVTGVQDYINDGSQSYNLVLGTISSSDAAYNGLNPSDFALTNAEVANQAPAVSYGAGPVTINEDSLRVFSSGTGNAITISDTDAGNSIVQLTLNSSKGYIALASLSNISFISGANATSAMVIQGTIADLNNALNGVTYWTYSDLNGADTFSLSVNDLGNSGTGGALVSTNNISITITPTNDAPVLSAAGLMSNQYEDGAIPYALVSSLVDTEVSDVDSGAVKGIAIYGVNDQSKGTWQYSLDGISWFSLAGVNVTSSRLLAADATTAIRFAPNADAGGFTPTFSYVAWDQTSGTAGTLADTSVTGGTTAYSAVTGGIAINVFAVSDAPVGADQTRTIAENTSGAPSNFVFNTTDFGFADPVDSPANAFAGVFITSLPGAGSLTLSGAAVTLNQFISAANLSAGNLVFTPAQNGNGVSYASFGFKVQDDGGIANGGADTDPIANTFTFDVTAVNTAPVISYGSGAVGMLEDNVWYFGSAFGNAITLSDTDAGSSIVQLTLSTPNATLNLSTLSGLTVTSGANGTGAMNITGTLASLNAALNGMYIAANPDFTGSSPISLQLNDLGNTGSGGALTGSRIITVTVNAVNDAPVATGASASLAPVLEDVANPAGATVATLFSSLFSDIDPNGGMNQFAGVAVRAFNQTPAEGVWQYSLDGGTSWSAFGAVSDASAVALASTNLIRFVPTINYNGSPVGTLSVRVMDNSSAFTAGSLIDVSAFTSTSSFSSGVVTLNTSVTSVNDAPAGSDQSRTLAENTAGAPSSYVFLSSDFGYSDTADNPANNFAGITLSTLPAAGSLTLSGSAVVAGQFVSAAQLAAGNLVFTPSVNANGTGYTSFTFQVQDDGGTANGGANTDPLANAFTFDVTAVNTAPTFSANALSIGEGATVVLSSANVSATDFDNTPAQLLITVSGQSSGQFEFVASPGVAITSFTQADIDAGLVQFVHDGSQTAPAYSLTVSDGTLSTGPQAAAITYASVNSAPTISYSGAVVGMQEDNVWYFGTAFGNAISLSDPDAAGASVQLTLSTPNGTLNLATLSGLTVTSGANGSGAMTVTGTLASLNAALDGMYIAANPNYNGPSPISLVLNDLGNTGTGGALSASRNITVAVNAVNDAPLATGKSAALVPVLEDATSPAGATVATLFASLFSDVDPNGGMNQFAGVAVVGHSQNNAEGHWQQYAFGSWVNFGGMSDSVALVLSPTDLIRFVPTSNFTGTVTGTLSVRLLDNAAGYTPGSLIDVSGGSAIGSYSAGVVTLNTSVTSVNDAPVGVDQSRTMLENTAGAPSSYVFLASDFGFSDPSDSPANNFAGITVSTLPGAGSLTLSGAAVTAGQFVTSAQITAGNLVFTPALNANGTGYASFTFQVQDDGGTANGGVDTDPSANTFSFDVTAVNTAPVFTVNTLTISEGATVVLSAANISVSDADNSASQLFITLNTLSSGQFEYVANPGVGIISFTQADINAGLVQFVHDGSQVAPTYSLNVSDGSLSDGPSAAAISFSGVNSAPVINYSGGVVGMLEDNVWYFGTAFGNAITLADADAGAASVQLDLSTPNGTLNLATLSGLTVTSGANGSGAMTVTGTLASLNAALNGMYIAANPNYNGPSPISLVLNDLGNTGTGGALTASRNITVTVNAVNDSPALNFAGLMSNQYEDSAIPFTLVSALVDNEVTDADSGALQGIAIFGVNDLSKGTWQYTLDGVSWNSIGGVSASASLLLAADATTALRFLPNADAGDFSPSFSYRAWDQTSGTAGSLGDASTSGGATAFSTASAGITINVFAVNDAPVGTDQSRTMLENTAGAPSSYVFLASDFGFSDPSDSPANNFAGITVSTLPSAGSLTLSGSAVVAGQFVTAAQITSGNLVFTPVANANGTGYASFTFQVQDDGGTANGGADTDPLANSFSFDVTAVNTAPTFSVNALTISEGSTVVLSAANIAAADSDNSASQLLITVSALSNGQFEFVASPGVAITSFTQADIDAGLVQFVHDGSQTAPAYSLTVTDGSLSTGPQAAAITYAALNSAPAINFAGGAVGMLEDNVWYFGSAFGNPITLADPDAGSSIVQLDLSTPNGTLNLATLSGLTVTSGANGSGAMTVTGTLASLNAALNGMYIAANPNYNGPSPISLVLNDLGNTGSGGALTASRTITVNVNAVNDAPVVTGASATLAPVLEDVTGPAGATIVTLFSSLFSDIDPNGGMNQFAGVAVRAYAQNLAEGVWQYSLDGGTSWSAFGAVSDASAVALTTSNLIRFVPAADYNGSPTGTLSVRVMDNSSAFTPGSLIDVSAFTSTSFFSSGVITLNTSITSVNDAPWGISQLRTINENTAAAPSSYVFLSTDFGFTDSADSPANNFAGITVNVLPGAGSLTLSGAAVTAGQFVTSAQLAAGNLVFTPLVNANGAGYANFVFTVRDDGGTSNGGVDSDTFQRNFSFDVTAVNTAPTFSANTLAISEGGSVVLSTANIAASDFDNTAAQLTITVSALSSGQFEYVASPGVAITSFTQADIDAGLVQFVHDGSQNAPVYSLTVTDGSLSTGPQAAAISYSAINSAPVISYGGGAQTFNEDSVLIFSAANANLIALSDPDAGSNLVELTFTSANGSLALGSFTGLTFISGANGSSAFVVRGSITDLNAAISYASYSAYPNFNGNTSLTLTLNDLGNSGSGGPLSASLSIPVTVNAINDAPLASGSASLAPILEDAANPAGATVSSLFSALFSDPADAANPAMNQFAGIAVRAYAQNLAEGAWQYSTNGGASWAYFGALSDSAAVALAPADLIRFLPAADYNGSPTGTLSVRLMDNSAAFTSGSLIDVSVFNSTVSFSSAVVSLSTFVTPVNDAPNITSNGGGTNTGAGSASLTLPENSTATITTVTAADIDLPGDTLTYSIAGGADAALFSIDSVTGALSLNLAALPQGLNFEAPLDVDGNGIYLVQVAVSDGAGGSDLQNLSLTITNLPEAPTAFNGSLISLNENTDTSAGLTVLASQGSAAASGSLASNPFSVADQDTSDTHILSIVGGADAARFSIIGTPGNYQLVFNAGVLNFEAQAAYSVTLRATDPAGLFIDKTLTLAVIDLNEAPTLTPLNVSINENPLAGQLLGTMNFADQDSGDSYSVSILPPTPGSVDDALLSALTIDNAGNVRIAKPELFDFESNLNGLQGHSLNLLVQVTDSHGAATQASLQITLNDVNETPNDLQVALQLIVNAPTETIGTLIPSDHDNPEKFTYEVLNDPAGAFILNSTTGTLSLSGAGQGLIDSGQTLSLTIQVQDKGGLQLARTFAVKMPSMYVPQVTPGIVPGTSGNQPSSTSDETKVILLSGAAATTTADGANTPTPISQGAQAKARSAPVAIYSEKDLGLTFGQMDAGHPLRAATQYASSTRANLDRTQGSAPDASVDLLTNNKLLAPSTISGPFSMSPLSNGPNLGESDSLHTPIGTVISVSGRPPVFGTLSTKLSPNDEAQASPSTFRSLLNGQPLQIAGTLVSFGAVWWVSRALGVASALIAGASAWQQVDVLPFVLQGIDPDKDDEPRASDLDTLLEKIAMASFFDAQDNELEEEAIGGLFDQYRSGWD